MTQIQLNFFIRHRRQTLTGPYLILRPLQQTGILRDRHRCFLTVTGDHDDLYTGALHLTDRFYRFRSYLIPNGKNAHQG